jgi:GTP-binding protein
MMFENQKFILSAYNIEQVPNNKIPQIILCGKSNVGKSSFINSVFNRKDLAKVSSTPGKTRSINFYLIDDKFYLVDLPGYGYAKVSKKERENWAKLIKVYLSKTTTIKFAFHFIDSRHNPSELDILLNKTLNFYSIPYAVIFNKIDKLKQSEISANAKRIMELFPELILNRNFFYFSAPKKRGKEKIMHHLESLFN